MTIRLLLLCSCLLSTAPRAGAAQLPPPKRNVLVLLADDLRWDALGCTGNKLVRTPHLDALAKKAVLFRNAFVTTSICAVSRASIFSGQYARRHRINDFAKAFTPEALDQTYPLLLRAAGYRIGFIGKFGVGNKMPAAAFDFWRGFPGQGNYFDKGVAAHMTSRMGDHALEFFQTWDRKSPFCLSVSFKSPHAQDGAKREFPPDPRDEDVYKDVVFPVAKTATEQHFQLLPEAVRKSESRKRWQRRFADPAMHQQTVRDYYRLVTGMDREVGRILAELERLGVLANTLVIVMSDNGFFLGEHGLADKWYLYEESVRIPLIIHDPALPRERQGQSVAAMALNIDVAPTILDAVGVAIPARMQGKSLRPLLAGAKTAWRTDFFYEHYTAKKIIPPSEGVRTERWTYLRWVETEPVSEELYDLHADPLQERNLAAQPGQRAQLELLRNRWESLRKELE